MKTKVQKISPNYISYKDLTARVVKEDGIFYRYIFQSYKSEYDHLMNSGLYKELVLNELLMPHEDIEIVQENQNIYKLLRPEQIIFQSYPFEWSFQQWRKAIKCYLNINQIALKYGMILKDATPYNFYVNTGKVVMFDTSSFIFFKQNDKWIAYKQFCEMFLSPLALMHYNGVAWGKLYLSQLQGLPLKFVSRQLPAKSWMNLTVLLHIHVHAKYVKDHEKEGDDDKKSAGFSIEKLKSMILLIKKSVESWDRPYLFENHWATYYDNDIETESYIQSKEETIENWLNLTKPVSVIDLGANIGKFSFIASRYSKKVIALESDESCVDQIDKQITLDNNKRVFPLVGDLASPSPGLGVMNKELLSIFERAPSEMVLCLALIHHLYFTKDMSFELIAELLSKLSTRYLIVEFIPKEDRKVKRLMVAKPERSDDYSFEHFLNKLLDYFQHLETVSLDSSTRSLVFLKKLDKNENKSVI